MRTVSLKNKMNQEAVFVSFLSATCLIVLALRIKMFHNIHFLFMGWNLFLALIPYGITWMLKYKSENFKRLPFVMNRLLLAVFLSIWLLFLPNAPYMITDFVHLETGTTYWWIDACIISFYSITGVLCLYLSLEHLKYLLEVVRLQLSNTMEKFIGHFIIFLCSVGVYLGRTLRYNSWDILQDTSSLIVDISNLFLHPLGFFSIWIKILTLTLLISLGFVLFQKLKFK